MIAGYIRVSSKGQDYKSQRHAIEQAAEARSLKIDTWYSEKRCATKKAPRPEYDRLIADALAGRISVLFTFRLDRLTRLGIGDTLETVRVLRDSGVTVHSLADGIGSIESGEVPALKKAMQEAMLAMLSVCAQIEGLARSERVSAARERMEAEGLPWGRPAKQRTLDATDRVHELKARGLTIREIAQHVRIPRSTVGRILSRKTEPDQTLAEPAKVATTA